MSSLRSQVRLDAGHAQGPCPWCAGVVCSSGSYVPSAAPKGAWRAWATRCLTTSREWEHFTPALSTLPPNCPPVPSAHCLPCNARLGRLLAPSPPHTHCPLCPHTAHTLPVVHLAAAGQGTVDRWPLHPPHTLPHLLPTHCPHTARRATGRSWARSGSSS